MKESELEHKSRDLIARSGGLMLKWVCPAMNGVPDNIVFWPAGLVGFIEFKKEGEKPRPLQEHMHAMLAQYGVKVQVFDSLEDVKSYITATAIQVSEKLVNEARTVPTLSADFD